MLSRYSFIPKVSYIAGKSYDSCFFLSFFLSFFLLLPFAEDTGIGLFGLFAGAAGPFFLLAFLASLTGAWRPWLLVSIFFVVL